MIQLNYIQIFNIQILKNSVKWPRELCSGGEGSQWCPPVLGSYKVSLACSSLPGHRDVGVGILIRDHSGIVVLATGFVNAKYIDKLINLSLVVFYALQLAFEIGFRNNIVVEVPSQEMLGLRVQASGVSMFVCFWSFD